MWLQNLRECIGVCLLATTYFPKWFFVALLIVPIFTVVAEIYVNNLIANKGGFWEIIILKGINELVHGLLHNKIIHHYTNNMAQSLLQRIKMGKIRLGVILPAKNITKYNELIDESQKLNDFLSIIPITWTTLITFTVSIINMNGNTLYFTLICIGFIFLLKCFSMPVNCIPPPNLITRIGNSDLVHTKLSMGIPMDENYYIRKQLQRLYQQDIRQTLVCILNIIITWISLSSNNYGQIHSFTSVSWMLRMFADNLRSFQHSNYIKEFFDLLNAFNKYEYKSIDTIPLGNFTTVTFHKASFGYYEDLVNSVDRIEKIKEFSYTFHCGIYDIEAKNGIGKSSLFKMFCYKLFDGKGYFGDIDIKNISFETMYTNVCYIRQFSEFAPHFTEEEILCFRGKDPDLEKALGLDSLWKDTRELSGGMKVRMFLYIALTSNATIILLDEILKELSTATTNLGDVNWFDQVINTLVAWKGISKKIIVIVGHTLKINNPAITKLTIETSKGGTTLLVPRKESL